jgi:hypothetical protein
VPEDKSDFRLVAKAPAAGGPPVGLRISKVVRGKDDSIYTFLLPGVVPNPLKLSVHPSGEIQLKAKGAGLIARLNKDVLIDGLKSGALDAALAAFLTPKLRQERAEGFVLRPDLLATTGLEPTKPLEDHDLELGRLLEGMTKVEIDDTRDIGRAIEVLRNEGLLPCKAMLQLATEGSDRPILFLSLLEKPLTGPPATLPEGLPMPKTMQAFLDSIREYGGILFTMPDESDIQAIAEAVGLGDLLAGLRRFADALDLPEVDVKVRSAIEGVITGFESPIGAVARAEPVRPLQKRRAPRERRQPPVGGWVRRRPRRRGHPAPLSNPR